MIRGRRATCAGAFGMLALSMDTRFIEVAVPIIATLLAVGRVLVVRALTRPTSGVMLSIRTILDVVVS